MELDYFAPELTGERFHETINALRKETWIARSELGWFVLDREAGSFFLRTKSATFPGLRIAEMFGVEEGPLLEEMRRNILHINGDAHRRLRNLVNPAFTPRAADRWRPAMRRPGKVALFVRRKNEPASRSSTNHPRSDFASHVSRRSALIVSWKRSPVRSGAK